MSSTAVRFVDTNILLYAISTDPSERDKTDVANEILEDRDLGLSVQVLQEFYVQATRESRMDRLPHALAVALVESFLRWPVAPMTSDLMLNAASARDRFGITYWDAAIIEASRSLGSRLVLSEDLADGRDYDGVRVENPFR